MKKYKLLLVPFLFTLGPVWMTSFTGGDWTLLRLAGIIGAMALSLGLIQLLSKVYYLQQRIEWLETTYPEKLSTSERHVDQHNAQTHFDGHPVRNSP